MKTLEMLGGDIRKALGHGISFSGGAISDPVPLLFAEEADLLGNVSLRRRREFAWGRHHAHEALRGLGVPPVPILSRVDRVPLWPSGVVGSISHSSSHCAAVAGRSDDVLALGIDVEDEEALGADLLRIICTPEEMERGEWCSNRLGSKLILVIKEAVYKSYASTTGKLLGFQDLNVTMDDLTGVFKAEIGNSEKLVNCGSRSINGIYLPFAGGVLAIAARFRGE
ncbi:4'-phosphopantetheinyl transferase [Bradyrhizobium sp. STM 3562]|uniref:4'-phosphopantetheinyl transferase family protein n=1 Tax=Bradyrhizobium sp. STM 3562 TaxID=578924 RepID=UPI00388F5C79